MRVVIVHYHGRAGGVSRVITYELQALCTSSSNCDVHLCIGETPDERFLSCNDPFTLHIIPELAYCRTVEMSHDERLRVVDLLAEKLSVLDTGETVFHVHNPTLGKNPLVTAAFLCMIKKGIPFLYQCHDFPEEREEMTAELCEFFGAEIVRDGFAELYPPLPNICYLLTNSSDTQREQFRDRCFEILPNPIVPLPSVHYSRQEIAHALSIPLTDRWILYPVRGIARKNIGEFLLLAYFFSSQNITWILTLPPENPVERHLYDDWSRCAQKFDLPVHLSAGEIVPYEALFPHVDRVVTTSEREGFGMAFLELWLAGIPVVGRDLPSVTNDFIREGVDFPVLYQHFFVPYLKEVVDFITLDHNERLLCVERILDHPQGRQLLADANDTLGALVAEIPLEITQKNRFVVGKRYSLDWYQKRIISLVETMLQ